MQKRILLFGEIFGIICSQKKWIGVFLLEGRKVKTEKISCVWVLDVDCLLFDSGAVLGFLENWRAGKPG